MTLLPAQNVAVRETMNPSCRLVVLFCVLAFFSCSSFPLFAADLEKARQEFLSGSYSNCIRHAEQAIRQNDFEEDWRLLLAKSLLTVGKYPEALTVISNALP